MNRLETLSEIANNGAFIDAHSHAGYVTHHLLNSDTPVYQSGLELEFEMRVNKVEYATVFPQPNFIYFLMELFDKEFAIPFNEDKHWIFKNYWELTGIILEMQEKFVSSFPSLERLTNEICFPQLFENMELINETKNYPNLLPFLQIDPASHRDLQLRLIDNISETMPIYGFKFHPVASQRDRLYGPKDLHGSGFIGMARKLEIPIFLHTQDEPNELSGFRLLELSRLYPEVNFAMGHSAFLSSEVLNQLTDCSYPNVYIDGAPFNNMHKWRAEGKFTTEGFPIDYTNALKAYSEFAERFSHRLIWGSDSNWNTTDQSGPKGLNANFSYNDEANLLFSLPMDLQKKIAHENTLRYLTQQKIN